MRLSRLQVGIKAEQLRMFGFASTKDVLPSVRAYESKVHNSIFRCDMDKKGVIDSTSPIPHKGRPTAVDHRTFMAHSRTRSY